jgi:inner membrane protein
MAGTAVDTAPSAKVSLFDPVNVYSLSYRATEYAFLFVLFTFTALALAEVVAGIRLHVVQYVLVGSALAVFFLLLIALSEHFAFDASYLAAAGACVCLLTFYLRHPLGSWGRTFVFSGIFAGLYGALYALLQSEDNALLMGSLLTFSILALVMVATRKVEWARLEMSIMGTPRPPRTSTPGGVPT